MRLFLGFLIGLVIAGAIAATAFKVAWGDISDIGERDRGNDKSESVAATDFDRIKIAGVFELGVSVGGEYSVTLSGKEDDLARTSAIVENGVLILHTRERGADGKRRFVKHGVTATISMPALSGIDVTGVVDGDITGVEAEKFDADVSGVGELELAGVCGTLDAEVSGVGELDAENLKCKVVSIDVSGVGEAKVYASDSADADIAGIGSIDIYGSPAQLSKSATPFGRIVIK